MLDLSRLPVIDPGTVYCLNNLLLYRSEYLIPLEGEADGLLVQVADQPLLDVSSGVVSVVFFAPFGTIAFSTEMALIDQLSDNLLPGWREEDPSKLKMEWRVVYCLEAVAERSVFAGLRVFVMGVETATELPTGPGLLPIRMTLGETVFAGQLVLANGVPAELSPYLPSLQPETKSPEALDIRFFPRVAGPVADYEALMNLSKGDVLILPDCVPGRLQLVMQIENGVDWHGICDDDGNFTLTRQENAQ